MVDSHGEAKWTSEALGYRFGKFVSKNKILKQCFESASEGSNFVVALFKALLIVLLVLVVLGLVIGAVVWLFSTVP